MQSLVPDFERNQDNRDGYGRGQALAASSFVHPTCKWMVRPQRQRPTTPIAELRMQTSSSPCLQRSIDPSSISIVQSLGLPDVQQDCSLGVAQQAGPSEQLPWWISRSSSLRSEHRNAWVVSLILEQYLKEEELAVTLKKQTFSDRMQDAGLASVLDNSVPPRKRCRELRSAPQHKAQLVDEHAQRLMLRAISKSIPAYVSGLRCWGAFCDSLETGMVSVSGRFP